MLFGVFGFSLIVCTQASTQNFVYPELRSDLQQYQDFSRCYPDVGKWHLMHRNYYSDPDFGGAAKCVTLERFGNYANFSTPMVFSFGEHGSTSGQMTLDSSPCYACRNKAFFEPYNNSVPQEIFYAIYTDCTTCTILRHHYAENGYGCSYWRRGDTIHEQADCCEFIYAENCGTAPKYQMYDASCGWDV